VRVGLNDVSRIRNASGSWIDEAGNIHGVSVNSGPRATVEQLAEGIPNKQIGVTTLQLIQKAGGYLKKDPIEGNPLHCLVGGLTPEPLSSLLTPTIANPCV
jgi:hypothetical protein